MCIECMTAAAVMGTVPVFIFDSACRVRIAGCRSTNEGARFSGHPRSSLYGVPCGGEYSCMRISSILIAAVAIGVPGPKMAAAPSA